MAITVNVTNHNHDTRYGFDGAVGAFDNLQTGRINDHLWYVDAADGGTGIQAVIDEAEAGDVIQLGAGTFAITSAIIADNPLTIAGLGRNATTLASTVANGYTFEASTSNITWRDFTATHVGAAPTSIVCFLRAYSDSAKVSGIRLFNVDITVTNSGSFACVGLSGTNAEFVIDQCNIRAVGTLTPSYVYGAYIYGTPEGGTLGNSYIRRSRIIAEHQGANSVDVIGLRHFISTGAAQQLITDAGCYFEGIGPAGATVVGAEVQGGGQALTMLGGHVAGADYDLRQLTSGVLTAIGTVLRNGTTNGTITYDGMVVAEDGYFSDDLYVGDEAQIVGALNHDGSTVGFYGVAPTARQLLATGAAATADNIITALQTLGLLRQT